jgi:hypothetical protein
LQFLVISGFVDVGTEVPMPKLLEEEVAFYREHRAELADRHPGEYVVVKNRILLGTFTTVREAYAAAAAHAPKQPALITRLPTAAERAAALVPPAGPQAVQEKCGPWSAPGTREALRAMGLQVRRELARSGAAARVRRDTVAGVPGIQREAD